jgi:TctA family transporter
MVELYEGVGFIPVLIGLFAFAQVFADIAEKTKSVSIAQLNLTFPPCANFSVLDHFIGSGLLAVNWRVAGAGCDIAAFVDTMKPNGFLEIRNRSARAIRTASSLPKLPKAAQPPALIPMMTLASPATRDPVML